MAPSNTRTASESCTATESLPTSRIVGTWRIGFRSIVAASCGRSQRSVPFKRSGGLFCSEISCSGARSPSVKLSS